MTLKFLDVSKSTFVHGDIQDKDKGQTIWDKLHRDIQQRGILHRDIHRDILLRNTGIEGTKLQTPNCTRRKLHGISWKNMKDTERTFFFFFFFFVT